jgi:hypothetical protein
MHASRSVARVLPAVTTLLVAACGAAAPAPSSSAGGARAAPATSNTPLDGCVAAGAKARTVTFTGAGEQITGAEFGSSGRVGVVLAHEYMSNLCGWVDYAQHLRDLGYRALAFDFGSQLVAGVNAAADELRHGGATRIVLMGASMGGTASLMAAAPPSGVTAVAALSAPSAFMGLDGAGASSTLSIPVLYMAAVDNGEFPGDARAMYAICPSAHKQLRILSGNDHGTALLHGAVATQAQSLLDSFVASSAG